MANAPLTIRFASDVDSAKKGIASLTTSIISNMATVQGSAIMAGRTVVSAGNSIIGTLQSIGKASSLAGPALGALALGAVATYAAFAAAAAIVNLAKERLEEYVKIADQAAKGGVTPEFFQRQAKAAEDYGIKLDDVASSLAKFRDASAPKLGGSDIEARLDKLTEAGNFKDNSGVAAYKSASSDEERYRAIVSLITQAADQGERLAGLDLAAKFLPPAMLDRLKSAPDFLAQMQKSADALASTKIVSDEDVARAVSLTARLDEAQKTLANKFKPIQNDLVQLGMNYHENWVSIVETMASAVEQANRLYKALSTEPQWLKDLGNADFWSKITNATTSPESRAAAEKALGITPIGDRSSADNPDGPEMTAAKAKLRGGLLNPSAVRLAGEQTTNTAMGVRKDTSKAPGPADTKEQLDSVERLLSQMQKLNDEEQVQLDTEGKSNIEREKGIALAKAEAAARSAQRDLTDDERSKVLALAEAHAVLANKLKDVQQALAANAENARFFGNEAATAFGNFFVDGQKANDILASILKQWAKFAIQAAFTGQGPLASILGMSTAASAGPNAVGGLAGLIGKNFTNPFSNADADPGSAANPLPGLTADDYSSGFLAGGGDVKAGRTYTVGETGMEKFIPGADGKIFPIGSGNGMSGMVFNNINQIDASGADSAAIARLYSGLSAVNASVESRAMAAYLAHQRRRA